MLIVNNLTSYYSNIKILKELSFNLNQGQVLCLLGRNGAGKTTTLKSIMGLVDKTKGSILFNNEKLSGISAHNIPKKGITIVRETKEKITLKILNDIFKTTKCLYFFKYVIILKK